MRTRVFWGEFKSGCVHSLALRPDDGYDVGGADPEETLRDRVVSDCGSRITSILFQAEEDVDA